MMNFLQSLRWRLQIWHGLLLLVVVVGFTLPTFHFARESQTQRIDRDLGRMERSLIRSLMDLIQGFQTDPSKPDYRQDRPFLQFSEFVQRLTSQPLQVPATMAAQFQGHEPGYSYFSIRDKDDKIILQSENTPADMRFLPIPASDFAEETHSIGSRRETARSISHGLKVVVGRDITPDLHEMQRMATLHVLIGLGVWLFGLIGGWWLSGRAIRPIRTISETATRIAEGNLEERINITETDSELGQLSQVLNQTFERLHDAFERQRQFTADASHELRTPVSILISETQRLLKRERTAEEYREALQTCGETAQRMRRLIESLLLLARQDGQTHAQPNMVCDLSDCLRDAVNQLKPLADERHRRLEASLCPAPCKANAEAISILATNLISNGLQHGGNVTVASRTDGSEAIFTVSDDGPGIAEADQPHIFERFYRADQARTGSSGHSGLGLAIAKAIVDNHGGSIRVVSEAGRGTTFEVRLPS
jgi:heavy metal sensor kinase